jgi:hypothetical protein
MQELRQQNHDRDSETLNARSSDSTAFSLAETPFQGYQQWVPTTFITAMVFKFCMVLVWFFLQGFISYVVGFSG